MMDEARVEATIAAHGWLAVMLGKHDVHRDMHGEDRVMPRMPSALANPLAPFNVPQNSSRMKVPSSI
jgi:hypothetical protein